MSTAVLTKALVIVASLALGFQLGSRSLRKVGAQEMVTLQKDSQVDQTNLSEGESETIEDTEELADGDLSVIKAKMFEACKLVLVVRTDLKMEAGDVSTECSTATLACYRALADKNPQLVRHWEMTGQAKIALKAKSEEQLLELEAIAKSLNLCARSVKKMRPMKDADGTRTVLGIGPAPVELMNQVTGKLRLL